MPPMTRERKIEYERMVSGAEQLSFSDEQLGVPKVYGYARISTGRQKIERQFDNIRHFDADAIILQEIYTGTTTDRPAWKKLKAKVRTGDTIIFDEVSRMSRNAEEGFADYQELFARGVKLVFLKERHIDTDVYRAAMDNQIAATGNKVVDYVLDGVNKALMELARQQIAIAFSTAQAEIDFLHKRTSEGVRQAAKRFDEEELLGSDHKKKRPGRQAGSSVVTKKSIAAKEKIRKLSKRFGGNMSDREVMELLKLGNQTYYKYKKELASEIEMCRTAG